MATANEIFRRRVAGSGALAVAVVVGTLAFGTLANSCQSNPTQPSPSISPGIAESTGPGPADSAPPLGTMIPSVEPGTSPTAPTDGAPMPTLRLPTAQPPPGEPGATIEVPPPIR